MSIGDIDYAIFFTLYGLSNSVFGKFAVIFLGEYLIYIAIFIFLIVAYRDWRKENRAHIGRYLLPLFSAFVSVGAVVAFIRIFVERNRPFITYSLPSILTEFSYSFPSAHTIFIFSLATGTLYFNKKLGVGLFVAGILIGAARVAGAVHYPSDIVAGALLGILTTLFVGTVLKAMYPKHV
ncbi:MAG: phosphatase PAP2 family protein [Patescibacteria group bacterium]